MAWSHYFCKKTQSWIFDRVLNKPYSRAFSEKLVIYPKWLVICPVQTNIYNIFDPKGLTFLTCLRLGLSHLNEHRFWHNFQDCLNPLCSCNLEIEDTSHCLLHCHHFSHHCVVLMNSVKSICDNFDNVWQCQRRFTFIGWLAIWWKQK